MARRRAAPRCFFAADLHGSLNRYRKLWQAVQDERPAAVFLGGDLLPHPLHPLLGDSGLPEDFIRGYLAVEVERVRRGLGEFFPRIFLILGNDDLRAEEEAIGEGEAAGLWCYLHRRQTEFQGRPLFGYACIPPSPFTLKDWEKYDVSRQLDPGCLAPEEGQHSLPVDRQALSRQTIAADLAEWAARRDLSRAVVLFHAPPYQTGLDRAALDGRAVDHAPLDVHIGSIAVRRFIETHQPWLTLHGHVHESARITGRWREKIGRTWCLSAAHDGAELSLVRFSLDCPQRARRQLI